MARILVAEDDPKQADVIRRYLEHEGHEVVAADNGAVALEETRRHEPDLVVLDVMMPGLDGFDVCRVLRYHSEVPVLFLTARSAEADLLLGLELGADDYLTKPFSPRELVARIRTVLRRSRPTATAATTEVSTHGPLEVDRRRARIRVDGQEVELTPKEYALLVALADDPGRAFTRRQLIDVAFGFEADLLERTVDVHIANLRRKLEPNGSSTTLIRTVKGIGYSFVENER